MEDTTNSRLPRSSCDGYKQSIQRLTSVNLCTQKSSRPQTLTERSCTRKKSPSDLNIQTVSISIFLAHILSGTYLQFFLPVIIKIIPVLLTFFLIDLDILIRMG